MNINKDSMHEKLDVSSKMAFILDVIKRYDNFTISTNFKASVIIAFNTLIVGSVILKFIDIDHASNLTWIKISVSLLSLMLAMSSLFSLFFVFRVIYPFFDAKSIKDNQEVSLVYFDAVSKLTGQDYFSRLENSSHEVIIKDLAEQATNMARGLTQKMIYMRHSIEATIISLGLILLLVFLKVFSYSF